MKRIDIHNNRQEGIDRGFENLANAIVLQAVLDYRRILRGRKVIYDGRQQVTKKELEDFFRSGWFHLLTKVDSKTIISKLKREYENERKAKRRNSK